MSPDEAPERTLCAVGHPGNGVVARKTGGKWICLHTDMELDTDTIYKSMTALWIPGYETTVR